MRSSIDQVVDVLNGWREDKRIVALILSSPKEDSVKVGGVVIDANRLALALTTGDFEVVVHLSPEMEFDWQDPRESPKHWRDSSGRVFESFLQFRSPDLFGMLFAFKLAEEGVDT